MTWPYELQSPCQPHPGERLRPVRLLACEASAFEALRDVAEAERTRPLGVMNPQTPSQQRAPRRALVFCVYPEIALRAGSPHERERKAKQLRIEACVRELGRAGLCGVGERRAAAGGEETG